VRRLVGGRAAVAACLAAAGLALIGPGCAKRGLPPGGPEDKTPPYVESLSPASGAVDVDPGGRVDLTFSEPMKRRTVETAVMVSPPCLWQKRYWDKNTYILVPAENLHAETTYLVSVAAAAADRHGVKMEKTFVAGFSTGSTIEAGVISGAVSWKNLTIERGVVEVFDAADAGDLAGFAALPPRYVTFSGTGGRYEIPFVDTRRTYRVLAFVDKDSDSERDEDEQVGCALREVAFADSTSATGVDITICDTALAGALEGKVTLSASPDTSAGAPPKVVVVARSASDSAKVYQAKCGADGSFAIGCVAPGGYLVEGFADFNGNQKQDLEDTFRIQAADTAYVAACARRAGVEMTLELGAKP
jgi:hypothetical protein